LLCGVILPLVAIAGCTIHPDGEKHERDLATAEGKPYVHSGEIQALPANPTPDDLVRYADLASPDLEQKYWEWKSAIEQIPQDGTQATNLVLYGNVPVTRGSTAFNRTVVTVANDPMADIQWPSKPTTAAQRALEEARAAGLRFQQAKFNLRQKVLGAYYDYALGAELVRLEQLNAALLTTTADVSEAGIASGKSSQSSALGTRNDAEMSSNQVIELQSHLPGLRAALNAALGRDPAVAFPSPPTLPSIRDVGPNADDLLRQIAHTSPELAALDAEARGKERGIKLAKLQYLPDFSLSASTDLGGIAQNLTGMVTVPLMRYQAINAAIAQAEANLRASEAMRRQTELDLKSRVIADVTAVDDLRRQTTLLEKTIIPRAEMLVTIDRSSYENGRVSMTDLLQSERSVVEIQRLDANLRVTAAQRLLDIESAIGQTLE
jgi:outer membrane protein TolC